jgi:5-methylcytosine-specific restriction endonuclease McrA
MVMPNQINANRPSRVSITPHAATSPGVPGALRDWVLGRDSFECRAPGCHRSHGLEVHLINPGEPGGHTNPANLITICPVCLPMWDLMGRGVFEEVCQNVRALSESRTA